MKIRFWHPLAIAAFVSGCLAGAQAVAQNYAYITNVGSIIGSTASGNTVSVIDTQINEVIRTITLPSVPNGPSINGPYGVAVGPDYSTVYVTNYNSDSVSVIYMANNSPAGIMVTDTIPVGGGPWGVAVSPDGSKIYVANSNGGTVSVITAGAGPGGTVTAIIPIGCNGYLQNPYGVAVSPDGSTVYVANQSFLNSCPGTVSVIDAASNMVTATIPVGVGSGPFGVAVSPDGSTVYVANVFSNTVSVIAAASNTVTATITGLNGPTGVAVSLDGGTVYVTNQGSGTVSVIAAASNTVIATIPVGSNPHGVAVSPDGSTVYVANTDSNTVSVIDRASNMVTGTVAGDPSSPFNGPNAFGVFMGPPSATLTVSVTGNGTGAVASVPFKITCGAGLSQCSEPFAANTQITLTATAGTGSMFTGWTDPTCSGYGTNPCELTLKADTTVTAGFSVIPSYMLSVSVAGAGTVTSMPSGINCDAGCSASFQSGTQVTLTASPASGSTFAGWGGACSGSGKSPSCEVTIAAATSVSATFNSPLGSGTGCNGTYNGAFEGNITVSPGQSCTFVSPGQSCTFASSPLSPSRISGNVTVNGGSFALLGGAVTGNVNENAGAVTLGQGAQVGGNFQVTGASSATVACATIGGNLQIRQVATGQSPSMICDARVNGNLQAQNDPSPLAVGTNNAMNCPGNTVGGNLQAGNNSAALSIDYNRVRGNLQVQNNTGGVDVSSNQVTANLQCQNNNPVPTHVGLNMADGNNQGQCAAFPPP